LVCDQNCFQIDTSVELTVDNTDIWYYALDVITDSGNASAWTPLYGGSKKLDTDTLNYIHRIYCRECRMEAEKRKMAEQQGGTKDEKSGGTSGDSGTPNTVPPQSPQVEESSLQQTMDKNKECKPMNKDGLCKNDCSL